MTKFFLRCYGVIYGTQKVIFAARLADDNVACQVIYSIAKCCLILCPFFVDHYTDGYGVL